MAMTLEYEKCGACGRENHKSLVQCRGCGGALVPARRAAAAPKVSAGSSLGDVAWGAIAVQILGGVVFVAGVFLWFGNVLGFFPTFPGVGYITGFIGAAIWRAGQAMD